MKIIIIIAEIVLAVLLCVGGVMYAKNGDSLACYGMLILGQQMLIHAKLDIIFQKV